MLGGERDCFVAFERGEEKYTFECERVNKYLMNNVHCSLFINEYWRVFN